MRTVAPRSLKCAAARSPTRSGCSYAAAVGSTTTSSDPDAATSSASSSRHPARNSPPPTRTSEPAFFLGLIGGGAYWRLGSRPAGVSAESGKRPKRDRKLPRSNLRTPRSGGIWGRDGNGGQAARNCRIRAHGLGRRGGRGQGGHRGDPAQPHRRLRRRVVRGTAEVAGAVRWNAASSRRRSPTTSPHACAPSPISTSSRRATSCLEAVVEDLPTKRELFGQLDRICAPGDDPGQQHVHAPDHRAGHGHDPPRTRLRAALLQSRAGHVVGGDRARAHHVGRDDDRGQGLRRGVRQDGCRRQRPGRLRRERAPLPVPQQCGEALRRRGRPVATTSTPR